MAERLFRVEEGREKSASVLVPLKRPSFVPVRSSIRASQIGERMRTCAVPYPRPLTCVSFAVSQYTKVVSLEAAQRDAFDDGC